MYLISNCPFQWEKKLSIHVMLYDSEGSLREKKSLNISSMMMSAVITSWPGHLKVGIGRETGEKDMWNCRRIGSIQGFCAGKHWMLTGHHQGWVAMELSRRYRHDIIPKLVYWRWHHHWRLRDHGRQAVTRPSILSTWEKKKHREHKHGVFTLPESL